MAVCASYARIYGGIHHRVIDYMRRPRNSSAARQMAPAARANSRSWARKDADARDPVRKAGVEDVLILPVRDVTPD